MVENTMYWGSEVDHQRYIVYVVIPSFILVSFDE